LLSESSLYELLATTATIIYQSEIEREIALNGEFSLDAIFQLAQGDVPLPIPEFCTACHIRCMRQVHIMATHLVKHDHGRKSIRRLLVRDLPSDGYERRLLSYQHAVLGQNQVRLHILHTEVDSEPICLHSVVCSIHY